MQRADRARVGEGHGGADEVVDRQLVRAGPLDEVLVRGVERGEVERVGGLEVRHEQRTGAVALLLIDRETEVDVFVADDDGLAVDDTEARVHARNAPERGGPPRTHEVREADFADAITCKLVVQNLPVDLEQLRGQGAHRSGGGYAEARFHVLDDACRGAPQRLWDLTVEHHRGAGPVGFGRRVRSGRGRRGRRSRDLGAGLVVGEELAPPCRHGVGVLAVQAVHLVDQARVGSELFEARPRVEPRVGRHRERTSFRDS